MGLWSGKIDQVREEEISPFTYSYCTRGVMSQPPYEKKFEIESISLWQEVDEVTKVAKVTEGKVAARKLGSAAL